MSKRYNYNRMRWSNYTRLHVGNTALISSNSIVVLLILSFGQHVPVAALSLENKSIMIIILLLIILQDRIRWILRLQKWHNFLWYRLSSVNHVPTIFYVLTIFKSLCLTCLTEHCTATCNKLFIKTNYFLCHFVCSS